MAITISGENNNDKILASDGVIDQLSGFSITGIITATTFTGNLVGNVTGNLTGNVNSTSPLLLQTDGGERFRITGNNELGIAGANYGTSGQVLTSGGSGSAVSWVTPAVTAFTNGSNNRVVTASSGSVLNGEANLVFNGSSLGIGEATPSQRLQVGGDNGDACLSLMRTNAASNNNAWGHVFFENSSDTTLASISARRESAADDAYLAFSTQSSGNSNVEKVRINSDGTVTLGQVDPNSTSALHIRSVTSTETTLELSTKSTYSGSLPAAKISFTQQNGTEIARIKCDTNTGAANMADLTFWTNYGGLYERLRIKKTGEVGIGTDNPLNKLDVRSGISVYSPNGSVRYQLGVDNSNGVSLLSKNAAGSYNTYQIDANTFAVRTTGTNSPVERVKIFSNGGTAISNAGSFPTSTNETLTVRGEGHNGHGTTNTRSVFNITAALTSRPGNGGGGLWVGARTDEDTAVVGTRTAAGNLAIETYSGGWGERLRITSGGQVRIANTDLTTSSKADNLIIGTTSGHTGITIFSGTGETGNIYFGDTNTSGVENRMGTITYDHSGNYMRFSTSGNQERLRITSGGQLYLGPYKTSTASLNVPYEIRVAPYGWGQSQDIAAISMGNHSGATGNDDGQIVFKTAHNAHTDANALKERLRINSSGTVGINEATNINGRLHVQHDALGENILYATRYNDQTNDKPILGITEATMTGMSASGLVIGNHNRPIHIGAVYGSSADVSTTSTVGLRLNSDGKNGINEGSPENQLHISGTTGTNAGGLLRLDATTGDNFIIFDNTSDSSEWAVGNDSGTRDQFRLHYNGGSGYGAPFVDLAAADGNVTIDGGTSTLVKIKGDSAGTAGLRLGGDNSQNQCTGFVEVHQDESHGGGMFYNGDGSPSFASYEGSDYFSLYRFSSGTRYSVMRWFHGNNDCEVQGNMIIDNGATGSSSTLLRVQADSAGTAGVSCGGSGASDGQTQCTGYVEVHQDQVHGGGIMYNGDGTPGFVNNESADHVTFYRMHNGTRERVFHYSYANNTVKFRGTIEAAGANANIKNFRITHPHPSKKDTHNLIHSSIEGPQCDNIYRGKVDLVGGTATVNIDTVSNMTDGTFVLLNRDIQCFTSNETGWTNVKGSVTGNLLTIIAQDNTCTDTISWMVVGERQDDGLKLEDVDTTDSDGKLIVELLREG